MSGWTRSSGNARRGTQSSTSSPSGVAARSWGNQPGGQAEVPLVLIARANIMEWRHPSAIPVSAQRTWELVGALS